MEKKALISLGSFRLHLCKRIDIFKNLARTTMHFIPSCIHRGGNYFIQMTRDERKQGTVNFFVIYFISSRVSSFDASTTTFAWIVL